MRPTALVRGVSSRFSQALQREPLPLDVGKAREQHRAYCTALRELGFELIELPALEDHADCCFVEDTAIVARGIALMTRPGAESRRGEVPTVEQALKPLVRLEPMLAPATLDGGDCLYVNGRWYIGRSERTNAQGIARAREVFTDVFEVKVEGALHLKSVCSEIGERIVLWEGAGFSFPGDVLRVPDVEAANVVALGERVLMPSGFPRSQALLERAGYDVRTVDNSEIRRADGALTCLSIRL